jgi:hypothetical protein
MTLPFLPHSLSLSLLPSLCPSPFSHSHPHPHPHSHSHSHSHPRCVLTLSPTLTLTVTVTPTVSLPFLPLSLSLCPYPFSHSHFSPADIEVVISKAESKTLRNRILGLVWQHIAWLLCGLIGAAMVRTCSVCVYVLRKHCISLIVSVYCLLILNQEAHNLSHLRLLQPPPLSIPLSLPLPCSAQFFPLFISPTLFSDSIHFTVSQSHGFLA